MIRVGTAPEAKRASERLTEEELLSAIPRRSSSREVRVGIFVLLGVISFLVALFTLTDVGTFRGRYHVTTLVQDAGGVRRGDPVQMRGVNIGRVVGFRMVPEGVAVTMELQKEYEVPADSRVTLSSSGLLGGMTAEVLPGRSGEALGDGDRVPGVRTAGLMDTAGEVGGQAGDVLTRVQGILSDRNIGGVGESVTELQTVLAELSGLAAEQRAELTALTGSLRRSAAGVERAAAGPELERAAARVDAITARLDETTVALDAASRSLASVLGRMERGEGTLGRLSTDDALYQNLSRAAENLSVLTDDIRRQPDKYFNVRVF